MIVVKIFAVILLLVGILNIAMGGSITFSNFRPPKLNVGLTYIALGIFMISGFIQLI